MLEIKIGGLVYVFKNEMPILDYLDQMADEVRDESTPSAAQDTPTH